MRAAAAYQRDPHLIIHPWSTTDSGMLIATGPVKVVAIDAGVDDLGRALREALDAAQEDLPHPSDWKAVQQPVLAAAGVKSWRSFVSGALYCHVTDDGGVVTLVPHRNLGTSQGFQDQGLRRVEVAADSGAGVLGEALRSAMAHAC